MNFPNIVIKPNSQKYWRKTLFFFCCCNNLCSVIVYLLKDRNAGSPRGATLREGGGPSTLMEFHLGSSSEELYSCWNVHMYTFGNIMPIKQLTNRTLLRQVTMTVEHRTKLQLVCPRKPVLTLLNQAMNLVQTVNDEWLTVSLTDEWVNLCSFCAPLVLLYKTHDVKNKTFFFFFFREVASHALACDCRSHAALCWRSLYQSIGTTLKNIVTAHHQPKNVLKLRIFILKLTT